MTIAGDWSNRPGHFFLHKSQNSERNEIAIHDGDLKVKLHDIINEKTMGHFVEYKPQISEKCIPSMFSKVYA